jgi:hypothetical protein
MTLFHNLDLRGQFFKRVFTPAEKSSHLQKKFAPTEKVCTYGKSLHLHTEKVHAYVWIKWRLATVDA